MSPSGGNGAVSNQQLVVLLPLLTLRGLALPYDALNSRPCFFCLSRPDSTNLGAILFLLKIALPDITEFKPTRRAETTLEQREKKTARGLVVGAADDAIPASRLAGFESKLTPIVDREEEQRKKSAAERFEEGPIVKGLKTATWFSICTLVLWEVYINSPWFTPPDSPPIL